jgi:hypothetical protein
MSTFLQQYYPNFAGTVTGGLLLSLLFFIFREWLFDVPHLTGIWECQLKTTKTSYRPYEGMLLWYRVTIVQDGSQVVGFGELDREESAAGARRCEGSARRSVEVSGRIDKNITKADSVRIVWSEDGLERRFSNFFSSM